MESATRVQILNETDLSLYTNTLEEGMKPVFSHITDRNGLFEEEALSLLPLVKVMMPLIDICRKCTGANKFTKT